MDIINIFLLYFLCESKITIRESHRTTKGPWDAEYNLKEKNWWCEIVTMRRLKEKRTTSPCILFYCRSPGYACFYVIGDFDHSRKKTTTYDSRRHQLLLRHHALPNNQERTYPTTSGTEQPSWDIPVAAPLWHIYHSSPLDGAISNTSAGLLSSDRLLSRQKATRPDWLLILRPISANGTITYVS